MKGQLAGALSYAARGWPVFPCHTIRDDACTCGNADCDAPGKHPLTEHGFKNATADKAITFKWWGQKPDANIAGATGPSFGLAIDVDADKGGDESLHDLEREHGELLATPTSHTGGGGQHLIFAYPELADGEIVKNKVGIAPGIDVRAEGGYIILPPSLHISGRRYEWDVENGPDTPMAPLPDWLRAMVVTPNNGHRPAEPIGDVIVDGKRNATLTSIGGAMRRHGATENGILAALTAENSARCKPPLADAEVQRIAGSVARYEAVKPKDSSPVVSVPLGQFLEAGTGRRPDVVAPIATSGITYIGGGPGQGKTLLAAEIAVTKASGISRLGFTAEAGPVLFVGADMGAEDTRDYFGMLMFEGRELALENLHVAITPGLLLDEPEGAEALRTRIQEVRAELVILDHFACFIGSDGFTNRDLRPVLDLLRDIRDIDRVPLLIADQTRKQSTGPNSGQAPAIDALYGGRAKGAIADRVVFIKKDAASGGFIVKGAKERGAGFADLCLSFDAEGGWERQDTLPQHLTPAEASVAAVITASANLNGRTVAEIAKETSFTPRTVQSALARLMYYQQVAHGPKHGRANTYVNYETTKNYENEGEIAPTAEL